LPSVSSASGANAGGRRVSAERLDEIALQCASLPDYDTRTPDEIIGYDEYGVPR
jgi:antitoxin VapB